MAGRTTRRQYSNAYGVNFRSTFITELSSEMHNKIHVHVSWPDLLDRIDAFSERRGISNQSEAVRQLLKAALDDAEAREAPKGRRAR